MQNSWIPLQCTVCQTEMKYGPSELPPQGGEFTCDHCGETRPIADFVMTEEGLKMLTEFHS